MFVIAKYCNTMHTSLARIIACSLRMCIKELCAMYHYVVCCHVHVRSPGVCSLSPTPLFPCSCQATPAAVSLALQGRLSLHSDRLPYRRDKGLLQELHHTAVHERPLPGRALCDVRVLPRQVQPHETLQPSVPHAVWSRSRRYSRCNHHTFGRSQDLLEHVRAACGYRIGEQGAGNGQGACQDTPSVRDSRIF